MANKTYRDGFFNALDFVSSLVIFLVTTKLMISKLGVDGYGFYTFFNSLIGTFGIVDIGMGMAVSKYLSEFFHRRLLDECNQVITQAIIFYLVVGMTLILIVGVFSSNLVNMFGFVDVFSDVGNDILILTTLVFFVNLFTSIATNILVAFEKWGTISFTNVFFKVVSSGLVIVVLLCGYSTNKKLLFIFIAIFFVSFFKCLFSWFLSVKIFSGIRLKKPSPTIRRKIITFLRWSSVQYALSLFIGHFDKIVISRFFGLDVLGVYNFVVNAFVYLYGFVGNVFKIILPKISKAHSYGDPDILMNLFKKNLQAIFIFTLMVGIVSIMIWNPFVSLYIDKEFAGQTFSYFVLFVIFLVVRSPEVVFSYFFNATAQPRILVINVAIGSLATVIGYFLFVPFFDAFGLIIAQIGGCASIYGYQIVRYRVTGLEYFSS